MARPSKSAKSKSSRSRRAPPPEEEGSVLVRLLLALVVLLGVAFAAATVRIGDTTVLDHMRAVIGWEPGGETPKPPPSATKAVARELEQKGTKQKAAKAAQPASAVPRGDNPPAEDIDDADRAALEKLLDQ